MKELGIVLDEKIKCQNCNFTLALRNPKDHEITIPSDIDFMIQALGRHTSLVTLQCKNCGCTVQVVKQY